jgi:hypothetical protein
MSCAYVQCLLRVSRSLHRPMTSRISANIELKSKPNQSAPKCTILVRQLQRKWVLCICLLVAVGRVILGTPCSSLLTGQHSALPATHSSAERSSAVLAALSTRRKSLSPNDGSRPKWSQDPVRLSVPFGPSQGRRGAFYLGIDLGIDQYCLLVLSGAQGTNATPVFRSVRMRWG